jgi:hypothetical protein
VIQLTPPPHRRQWRDPCIQSDSARRRRRRLTHTMVDLCSLFVWNFDIMTILCHDSGLLFLCTFVIMNLVDSGLLMLYTFLAMTSAMNLWICVSKLTICEVVNM